MPPQRAMHCLILCAPFRRSEGANLKLSKKEAGELVRGILLEEVREMLGDAASDEELLSMISVRAEAHAREHKEAGGRSKRRRRRKGAHRDREASSSESDPNASPSPSASESDGRSGSDSDTSTHAKHRTPPLPEKLAQLVISKAFLSLFHTLFFFFYRFA